MASSVLVVPRWVMNEAASRGVDVQAEGDAFAVKCGFESCRVVVDESKPVRPADADIEPFEPPHVTVL